MFSFLKRNKKQATKPATQTMPEAPRKVSEANNTEKEAAKAILNKHFSEESFLEELNSIDVSRQIRYQLERMKFVILGSDFNSFKEHVNRGEWA